MHHLFFWRPLVSFRPQPVGRGNRGTVGVCLDVVGFCFSTVFFVFCCFKFVCSINMLFWFDWHVVWEMLTVDDTCASRMFGRLSKVLHVFESGIEDVFIRSSETEQHVLGNFHYWKFTTYKTLGKWMWLDMEMKNLSVFWDTHRFHVRFFRLFSIVKQYLMAWYSNV